MMDDAEVKALLDGATPGPWEWGGHPDHLKLQTVHHGKLYVMDFVRKGFSGAQPRFQPAKRGMVNADALLQFQVGDQTIVGEKAARADGSVYRYDVRGVDAPDARLIAAAPDLARALLAARADTEAAHERGMDEAADKILDWLAKAVGAKEYTACDGSETWDGDVQGTIYAILKAGNVYDEEDGRVAKLADTEAAVALALEEAADLHAKLWRETSAYKESQIRALAPASGVAKLAALRAERDEWKAVSKTLSEMQAGEYKRADTLAAELAAANAREAGLREASALLRGHAGAAASLLRKFGISESVAEFLEAAVAEHDAALAQPSTEGGE